MHPIPMRCYAKLAPMRSDASLRLPQQANPRGRAASAVVLLVLLAPPSVACDVVASSLAFGAIDPLAGLATDSSSSITVSCPTPAPYTISISTGQSGQLQRRMAAGAA